MRSSFELNFGLWMEASLAKDAVLGVVSGGEELGAEEKSHLMSRKTTDFSAEIRRKLKGLGVVKSVAGNSRVIDIRRSIEDGILISDLLKKLEAGTLKEDRYESDFDAMARYADPSYETRRQLPRHMRTRRDFAEHLRKKGMSEDEIRKAMEARFVDQTP